MTAASADAFVARQPIFDRRLEVFGYELLFRSAAVQHAFPGLDHTVASSQVLNHGLFTIGWETLTGGQRAFVNFTRDLLVGGYATMLPRDLVVIEVLENVEPDAAVLDACRALRQAGYVIALDDFVWREDHEALLPLADIVKVDVLASPPATVSATIARLRDRRVRILAEKVETRAQFSAMLDAGCSYFQGHFFRKPAVVSGRSTPGFVGTYAQLLAETKRPELDYGRLERLIKQDVSLSYKFLHSINAASFGWRSRITSIRHALGLLGEREIRKWVALVTVTGLASGKPTELAVSALVRARFCESLSESSGLADRRLDLFLLGMFSMLDAILDRPMSEAATAVPVADDVRAALLGERNPLRDVLDVVVAYERGRWDDVAAPVARLGLDEGLLPGQYVDGLGWAQDVFGDRSAPAAEQGQRHHEVVG